MTEHVPARPTAKLLRHRPVRLNFRRASLTAALVSALVLIPVGLASAHVTVHPDTTAAGAESAEMVFRVPTESATASTTALELSLPTTHPLAEVLARPIAGWKVSVTEGKLPTPVVVDGTTLTEAPLTVTWTAITKDAQVRPGQYQDFAISAGPLPDSGTVTFTAKQTYSDGTVVNWNQPQKAGQDEPEHPAPSFAVTPAAADDDAAATSTATPTAPAAADASTTGQTKASVDHAARWLGGAGLALGVVAVGIAVIGLRRRDPHQP